MAAAEHICHDGNERDALNPSSELNNKNWQKHRKTVDGQGIAAFFSYLLSSVLLKSMGLLELRNTTLVIPEIVQGYCEGMIKIRLTGL